MSKTWAILPRQASDNLLRECGYEVKDMTEQTDELADRIKAALSGEIKLTGKACPHGYDLAVCPSRECKNPYAVETLLEEAEAALRASGHGAGREAEGIRWLRVNDEPYEYAIQPGPHGDKFVRLLNGTYLRRAAPSPDDQPEMKQDANS